jgi:hypothetical protein
MTPKLIVKWNLPRLARDLAAHLDSLERAGRYYSTMQADDYLEPYNLSPDDLGTVVGLALNKGCIDCGRLWDNYVVRDDVWQQAGLLPTDNCCRECLPLRLKRPLRPDDFTYSGSLVGEDSPARRAAVQEWRTATVPVLLPQVPGGAAGPSASAAGLHALNHWGDCHAHKRSDRTLEPTHGIAR